MISDENVIDLDVKRRQKQRKGQSQKEQEYEDLLEAAKAWLDETQLREVLRLGCYFAKTASGDWIPIKKNHFSSHYPEWNAKFAKAVTHVMHDRGWNYYDATYTFRTPPVDILNLMDRSHWLNPEKGEYHWIFDVLTHSIGGGKEENVEHIRYCITYKYLHPEAYTIPNLVIHGEGSIGKGLMIDFVLKTVFGGGTLTDMAENICAGGFNSPIKGKTVVCVDESMKERTDANKMKRFAGNPYITINEKNIPALTADNLIWYWIVSNEKETAGIWLDRSHADRRYSVLHVEQGLTLEYWIARAQGWLQEDYTPEQYETQTKRAKQWMFAEGIEHLTNPTEISHWLNGLIEEYGPEGTPTGTSRCGLQPADGGATTCG